MLKSYVPELPPAIPKVWGSLSHGFLRDKRGRWSMEPDVLVPEGERRSGTRGPCETPGLLGRGA